VVKKELAVLKQVKSPALDAKGKSEAEKELEVLQRVKLIVLDAVPSLETKRAYGKALDDFLRWYVSERRDFNKAAVSAYRVSLEQQHLSASSINVRLSAIRKLATEAADNRFLAPEIAAGISRVKGAKRLGIKTGNWLSLSESENLITLPDERTLKGTRDRALLGVLIGCGLRRAELAALQIERIQQRDARWVISDLTSKGGRVRTVPIPNWAKSLIEKWTEAAGINAGYVFRPVNKGDHLTGERMTAQSVFVAVKKYAKRLGANSVSPHDLRRTFAKLAHKGHAALEQIQLSLGHESIQTTERYIGVRQDLEDAPCDHLGIHIKT
jgi:site-specific recombinase XerD